MSKQESINTKFLALNMSSITDSYNMGTMTPNEYIGQIRWEIEFYDLCNINDKEKLETFK